MFFVKIQKKPDFLPFFREILEHGYHVFSLKRAKLPDYYPNTFPDCPGVALRNLRVGEVIFIRGFFRVGAGAMLGAEGGLLDLEVEHIEEDKVFGVILTELSREFPLQTGDSLDAYPNEILNKAERTKH